MTAISAKSPSFHVLKSPSTQSKMVSNCLCEYTLRHSHFRVMSKCCLNLADKIVLLTFHHWAPPKDGASLTSHLCSGYIFSWQRCRKRVIVKSSAANIFNGMPNYHFFGYQLRTLGWQQKENVSLARSSQAYLSKSPLTGFNGASSLGERLRFAAQLEPKVRTCHAK